MKKLKYIFNLFVVFLVMFTATGVGAQTAVPVLISADICPTLSTGDLFTVPNSSAVYLLNQNLERMYFPHSSVYHTWYEDFSSVVEIPNDCVDNYPAPSSAPFGVNYRPGSKLVKVQISPSVYAIEPGNKLRKIGSEDVARSLYGVDWASKVVDIADVFWPNYTERGGQIIEAIPHDGMFLRTLNQDGIFYVKNGKKILYDYSIESRQLKDIITVPDYVFDSLGTAEGLETDSGVFGDPAQEIVLTPEEDETTEDTTTEEVVLLDSEIRLTSAEGESVKPAFVWGDDGYGVVWSDYRGDVVGSEIYFTRIDENGVKLTDNIKITNTPDLISTNPEIVWNGTEFVIVYAEYDSNVSMSTDIKFVRLNKDGSKASSEILVKSESGITIPDMAWDGSGYGIIWRTPSNSNAKTYFSYVDSNDSIKTSEVRVLTEIASDQTDIIWDGKMFGIVYRQAQEFIPYGESLDFTVGTYLHRIDDRGDSVRNITFITSKESYDALWDGSEYVTAEKDKTFSIFDINGNLDFTNEEFSTTGFDNLSIINDGTTYGIVGERDGFVYFSEVDKFGLIKQDGVQVSKDSNTSDNLPKVGWSGNKYGVIWSSTKDGNSGGEIYFKAVERAE
jgi:hypothetical protein